MAVELSQPKLGQPMPVQANQTLGAPSHKPIKLHLSEGKGKYHAAPERPQPSSVSTGVVSAASKTLVSESGDSKDFSTSEFFHCAFSCHHKVSCEESCMQRHHMTSLHIQQSKDENAHYAVIKGV